MSSHPQPQSLVSTQWVADHLTDSQVRPVEVFRTASPTYGKPAYDSKHVPGAVAWDMDNDLQDPARRDVVDKAGLEALLSRSGLTNQTTIVLYSGLNNMLATFAFWLLRFYGHHDIRLMDGNRQKWLDENRPATAEVPTITPALYQAQKPNWRLRASRAHVLESLGKTNQILVDARSAEMFSGQDKAGAARGGHIPGAINLAARPEENPDGSFKAWHVPTIQPDGTFKPVPELRALLNSLGITRDKAIITYCVRGGLSTLAWFALTQLLGYPNVREYDRSWLEWGNLEDVPVET